MTFGGKIRLVLEDGARIDLGGGELDVYQFIGNQTAVNGTIKPARGIGTMIFVR